jgi:hypothetical protein
MLILSRIKGGASAVANVDLLTTAPTVISACPSRRRWFRVKKIPKEIDRNEMKTGSVKQSVRSLIRDSISPSLLRLRRPLLTVAFSSEILQNLPAQLRRFQPLLT